METDPRISQSQAMLCGVLGKRRGGEGDVEMMVILMTIRMMVLSKGCVLLQLL